MLIRFIRTLLTALPHIGSLNKPRLLASPAIPRPLWDNGIDYDIPTYLRRNVM